MFKSIYLFTIIFVLILYLILYKKKINEKFINIKKKKIALIICGFAPRSFKYVLPNIKTNIINHLKFFNFDVDIFHHSLLSKKNKIESERIEEKNFTINNNDVNLLPCNIQTEYQEDIILPSNEFNCWYDRNFFKNACRGIYSEYKAYKMIDPKKYDSVILITSDSLFLKPISIIELNDTINNKNIIYTTPFNHSGGIANGFYICHPSVLEKITTRINYFKEYYNFNLSKKSSKQVLNPIYKINSETFLQYIIDKHKIINKKSSMFYLKIRANKKSNWYINFIDKYFIPNSLEIKKQFK